MEEQQVKIMGRTSPLMRTIRANRRQADAAVEKYVANLARPAGSAEPRPTVDEARKAIAEIRKAHARHDVRALLDAMGVPARTVEPQTSRLAKHLRRFGKLCPWWTVHHQRIALKECRWSREAKALRGERAGK